MSTIDVPSRALTVSYAVSALPFLVPLTPTGPNPHAKTKTPTARPRPIQRMPWPADQDGLTYAAVFLSLCSRRGGKLERGRAGNKKRGVYTAGSNTLPVRRQKKGAYRVWWAPSKLDMLLAR